MAVNAASCALTISDIPWNGPIGAVRVGLVDGELVANPSIAEMQDSQLDLRMAGSREAIIMVEAGASEVTEDLLIQALEFGHEALQPIIDLQLEMREAVGKEKRDVEFAATDEDLDASVRQRIGDQLKTIVATESERDARNAAIEELRDEVVGELSSMMRPSIQSPSAR